MSKEVLKKVNEELTLLQSEVTKFQSAVEYMNMANSHVKEAVKTVQKSNQFYTGKIEDLKNLHNRFSSLKTDIEKVILGIAEIDFPERLSKIETLLESTVIKIQTANNDSKEELQEAVKEIKRADIEGNINRLVSKTKELIKSNETFFWDFKNLKIESKLKSIDANAEDLIIKTRNLDLKLDGVERNIKDDVKSLNQSLDKLRESFNREMEIQTLSQKRFLEEKFDLIFNEMNTINTKIKKNNQIVWAFIVAPILLILILLIAK